MLKLADYDMEEPEKEKTLPDPDPELPDPADTTYGLEFIPEEKPKLNWFQRLVKSIFRIS